MIMAIILRMSCFLRYCSVEVFKQVVCGDHNVADQEEVQQQEGTITRISLHEDYNSNTLKVKVNISYLIQRLFIIIQKLSRLKLTFSI